MSLMLVDTDTQVAIAGMAFLPAKLCDFKANPGKFWLLTKPVEVTSAIGLAARELQL